MKNNQKCISTTYNIDFLSALTNEQVVIDENRWLSTAVVDCRQSMADNSRWQSSSPDICVFRRHIIYEKKRNYSKHSDDFCVKFYMEL